MGVRFCHRTESDLFFFLLYCMIEWKVSLWSLFMYIVVLENVIYHLGMKDLIF